MTPQSPTPATRLEAILCRAHGDAQEEDVKHLRDSLLAQNSVNLDMPILSRVFGGRRTKVQLCKACDYQAKALALIQEHGATMELDTLRQLIEDAKVFVTFTLSCISMAHTPPSV